MLTLREMIDLVEAVDKNVLYHGTSINNAVSILENNLIEPTTFQKKSRYLPGAPDKIDYFKGCSLTRSMSVARRFAGIVKHRLGGVVFELNKTELKMTNRIIPMSFWDSSGISLGEPSIRGKNIIEDIEDEEFCVGPIKNLYRYLTAVYIGQSEYTISRLLKTKYPHVELKLVF